MSPPPPPPPKKKKFEWHFSDRLTFSNTSGRLLIKFIDCLLGSTFLVSKSLLTCTLLFCFPKGTTVAVGRPDSKLNHCRTGEECKCEELRLRKGSHTEMTRLSQPWHKVVTTLGQGCHNAFLQPWHNLGTTLYFETVARL